MVVILMGVTGAGKTTVGEALAAELRWRFADADDYHSPSNIAKMRAGIPLDDADRAPWLQSLQDAIARWTNAGDNVVLACSALKDSYRQLLVVSPDVCFVYLRGSFDAISQRLRGRTNHYMNPTLLRSQFETLEEPRNVLVIDADQGVQQIVSEIRAALCV